MKFVSWNSNRISRARLIFQDKLQIKLCFMAAYKCVSKDEEIAEGRHQAINWCWIDGEGGRIFLRNSTIYAWVI